jgi:hypothetical protein
LPNAFDWAVSAAECSDYLEKLDDAHPSFGPVPPLGAPRRDLVDIAHVRWATGTAITALDLCAATIGQLFVPPALHPGSKELSLRHFDPACPPRFQADVTGRRDALQPVPDFLQWVDDTLADPHYIDMHEARNPFTHAWLQRHLTGGTDASAGHRDRTKFTVLGTSYQTNAREMVETSAALALDRVRAFIDVVDHH